MEDLDELLTRLNGILWHKKKLPQEVVDVHL
jgi:hypothetical protein